MDLDLASVLLKPPTVLSSSLSTIPVALIRRLTISTAASLSQKVYNSCTVTRRRSPVDEGTLATRKFSRQRSQTRNRGCKLAAAVFPKTSHRTDPPAHVPAKRYLCAIDTQYWSGLSDGSKSSLVKQGGPMAEREVDEFELAAGHDAAVRLRRIDDQAKVVDLEVPSLSHYADAVLSVLTTPVQ